MKTNLNGPHVQALSEGYSGCIEDVGLKREEDWGVETVMAEHGIEKTIRQVLEERMLGVFDFVCKGISDKLSA